MGPQPLRLRNHNSGLAQRIMYGPFNPYIPIRSTTIGKSRVAKDPIAMHTSWRSNSDFASVTSIGYPRMSASGESSTTMHRLLHASGSHPIPPPNDPNQLSLPTSQLSSVQLSHVVQLSRTIQLTNHTQLLAYRSCALQHRSEDQLSPKSTAQTACTMHSSTDHTSRLDHTSLAQGKLHSTKQLTQTQLTAPKLGTAHDMHSCIARSNRLDHGDIDTPIISQVGGPPRPVDRPSYAGKLAGHPDPLTGIHTSVNWRGVSAHRLTFTLVSYQILIIGIDSDVEMPEYMSNGASISVVEVFQLLVSIQLLDISDVEAFSRYNQMLQTIPLLKRLAIVKYSAVGITQVLKHSAVANIQLSLSIQLCVCVLFGVARSSPGARLDD
ncbi:leucine rich repeat protein [Dorcoceras hygrometricum]|uniref:Leucine rich repeat protein n=1 Tax=Dorcoceras hygrometricum TaxID=472368 RepID=A0A2Z7ANY8_9LAMI|nr:leucine rich repeat protein [Dorcoceras hygrometricum]